MTAGLAGLQGPCLVVNADLPCASPAALRDLAARGHAHVPARDGTTNALSLVSPERFEPLYGAGSSARFGAAGLPAAAIPELQHDVDTFADLELLTRPVGRRTSVVLEPLRARAGAPPVRVVCLSGGVGGAKLAAGLYDVLDPGELTVIGNVGDDLDVLGLHVSPDLDSVLYGLAGLNDTERGWGRAGETWQALESARAWGGEGWFMLGDLDLGLHLVRTQALRGGEDLAQITARLVRAAGLEARVLPATNDRLRTHLVTPAGTFAFQEWFVARRHEDEVDALRYEGAEAATPAPGVLEALDEADAIVFAPSNPFVSIHPILAVPGIAAAIRARRVSVGCGQPADRRQGRPRPARPHDAAASRRDEPRPRHTLLPGSHRPARHRSGRRSD